MAGLSILNAGRLPPVWQAGWLVLIGLALLYLPTWWDLAHTTWQEEEQSHGPLALLVAAYLIWARRGELAELVDAPRPLAGWSLLALGLLLYAVGRSQQVIIFESASQIPVLLGLVLLAKGAAAVRRLWFPIFFLIFMIPLPGFLVSAATGPLKESVSAIADTLLYQLGYPVARSGVTLVIGQYQLLVADTCSGLNSILALAAVGVLYLHLTWRRGWIGNWLLLAAMLPIAYAANVVRVLFLVLLTYHAGDAAAQGFLHGLASMVLFASAVLLLHGLAALLARLLVPPAVVEFAAPYPVTAVSASTSGRSISIAGLAMLAGAGLSLLLVAQPSPQVTPIDLQAMIPQRFGDWQADTQVLPFQPLPELQARLDASYAQTLTRSYVHRSGQRLILALAYGNSSKVHNPEVCYPGQGYSLDQHSEAIIDTGHLSLPVQLLLTHRGPIPEPVTYWLLAGEQVSNFGAAWRLRQLQYSLLGQVPDGLVFRVSSLGVEPALAYTLQADFIRALIATVPAEARIRLIGKGAR